LWSGHRQAGQRTARARDRKAVAPGIADADRRTARRSSDHVRRRGTERGQHGTKTTRQCPPPKPLARDPESVPQVLRRRHGDQPGLTGSSAPYLRRGPAARVRLTRPDTSGTSSPGAAPAIPPAEQRRTDVSVGLPRGAAPRPGPPSETGEANEVTSPAGRAGLYPEPPERPGPRAPPGQRREVRFPSPLPRDTQVGGKHEQRRVRTAPTGRNRATRATAA
jgi:hypothetical protein